MPPTLLARADEVIVRSDSSVALNPACLHSSRPSLARQETNSRIKTEARRVGGYCGAERKCEKASITTRRFG